jgi:DegV family protein with EDD domain
MVRTLVVTDSSACLPPSVRRRAGLHVLPVTIVAGGHEGADDTIEPALVWRALGAGEPVWARAPSAGDYLVAVEEPEYDAAVVITPAAEFAVMHDHAELAATIASRPVAVVDSRTAVSAQGLVVEAALGAAAKGLSIVDVVERARDASRRARLVATMAGLGLLERTGNVPAAVVDAVRHCGGRPMFELCDGAVVPIEPTDHEPLRALAAAIASRDDGPGRSAVTFHADAPREAAHLRRLLDLRGPTTELSLAMAVHTGPGVVGLAWLQELDPPARVAAHRYRSGASTRTSKGARSQPGTITSNRSRSTADSTARATRSG